jgi:hypothetical protein
MMAAGLTATGFNPGAKGPSAGPASMFMGMGPSKPKPIPAHVKAASATKPVGTAKPVEQANESEPPKASVPSGESGPTAAVEQTK